MPVDPTALLRPGSGSDARALLQLAGPAAARGPVRSGGRHHRATVANAGGYRRFTLPMLRDVIVASARQGWFSVEDIRYALRAVIEASYRETGEFQGSKVGAH